MSTSGSTMSTSSGFEPSDGLCVLAMVVDASSEESREQARTKALAFSGKMRAAMRDTWRRMEEVCRDYERKYMRAFDENRERIRRGEEPVVHEPRPPVMAVRIMGSDGQKAYIMHTDLVQIDDVQRMADYELACRKNFGKPPDMPESETPALVDPRYVGKVMRRDARCEVAINEAYK